MLELDPFQIDAIEKMKNGCILCGDVGSGKSRTSLAYYFIKVCSGELPVHCDSEKELPWDLPKYTRWKKMERPMNLYIITTAKKRDDLDWQKECTHFLLSDDPSLSFCNITVTVDSWNNISKYKHVTDSFFIFDEQRLVGSGAWVKSFLRIAKFNQWVLLSATPGDKWQDYIAVFIANGFYRNKTEFCNRHFIYEPNRSFPKIKMVLDEDHLLKLKHQLLVDIHVQKQTTRHEVTLFCEYDRQKYRTVLRDRWDPYEDEPIKEPAKLSYLLRRVVNSDETRLLELWSIIEKHKYVIVFYNFTYELEALKTLLDEKNYTYAEYNGSRHETIPTKQKGWVYLVQYTAGSEAWECIKTNIMVFFSQNSSYRITEQSKGRIDRRNTPFHDLYYYRLRSRAPIDNRIYQLYMEKKDFNADQYGKELFYEGGN